MVVLLLMHMVILQGKIRTVILYLVVQSVILLLQGPVLVHLANNILLVFQVLLLHFQVCIFLEIKKAKGIKRCVVVKKSNNEQYKECLFEQKTFRHDMNVLQSKKHQIYGLHINKTSLSPLDTKRWITDGGIITNAYGYKCTT
jgi:hypothetical protein